MKFFNLLAYTALIALISSHSAEAQSAAPAAPSAAPAAPSPAANPPPPSLSDLPVFNYSLTQKSPGERAVLCAQNKDYCTTNCGSVNKTPMNFCNNETMGWGCGCSDKVPDFQAYQWPINYADCIGKGEACKQACAATNTTCIQACSAYYSNRCGTSSQPPAYYTTSDVNTPPSYGPPKNDSTLGGSANGTSPSGTTSSSNSSSTNSAKSDASSLSMAFSSISSAISALVIVAAGMTML